MWCRIKIILYKTHFYTLEIFDDLLSILFSMGIVGMWFYAIMKIGNGARGNMRTKHCGFVWLISCDMAGA